ncbi:unnamed protein product [Soboliphyme baturini]|uniref:RRM domain-containing protein n=1 Tax=Soboliphyme baturini TaxID=241478 RepID=A0A183IZ16_9BILA|nr:unnamed protein product [Soboliphyme baturini]
MLCIRLRDALFLSHGSREARGNFAASTSTRYSSESRPFCRSYVAANDERDSSSHGSSLKELCPVSSSTTGTYSAQCKPTAIVVRNLPLRSSDSSIKDGLFFTYKKFGKVVSVKVIGEGAERYALVTFRRSSDAQKATETSNNDMFFGSKIAVELASAGLDGDDNERRPLEKDIDQYHSKSSRTLYVGNLENRITPEELREVFERFGCVLDVDIKNRETPAPFAFIQYCDITSVVKAIHAMEQDGYIGNNKIKVVPAASTVGFGKPLPSTMIWINELPGYITDDHLSRKMGYYGKVVSVEIDRVRHQALLNYDCVESAQKAVTDMKTRTIDRKKVQVDFCSRELHDLFNERLYASDSTRGKETFRSYDEAVSPGLRPSCSSSRASKPYHEVSYAAHDNFYEHAGTKNHVSKKKAFASRRSPRLACSERNHYEHYRDEDVVEDYESYDDDDRCVAAVPQETVQKLHAHSKPAVSISPEPVAATERSDVSIVEGLTSETQDHSEGDEQKNCQPSKVEHTLVTCDTVAGSADPPPLPTVATMETGEIRDSLSDISSDNDKAERVSSDNKFSPSSLSSVPGELSSGRTSAGNEQIMRQVKAASTSLQTHKPKLIPLELLPNCESLMDPRLLIPYSGNLFDNFPLPLFAKRSSHSKSSFHVSSITNPLASRMFHSDTASADASGCVRHFAGDSVASAQRSCSLAIPDLSSSGSSSAALPDAPLSCDALASPSTSSSFPFRDLTSDLSAFSDDHPATVPHRLSLEERIKALDAKFHALDRMIQGAKERPQHRLSSSIDYSKYKVVRKSCATQPLVNNGNLHSEGKI